MNLVLAPRALDALTYAAGAARAGAHRFFGTIERSCRWLANSEGRKQPNHFLDMAGGPAMDSLNAHPRPLHPLPAPTRADVTEVARRTAARVERILGLHGRSLERHGQVEECDRLTADGPTLAVYYAAAAQGISVAGDRAGKPTLRLVVSDGPTSTRNADDDEPVAEVRGINVHAKQRVDGRDRAQIERLCRYITRPPLSQERLTRRADGPRARLPFLSARISGTCRLAQAPRPSFCFTG